MHSVQIHNKVKTLSTVEQFQLIVLSLSPNATYLNQSYDKVINLHLSPYVICHT